jgi:hypothetical protein
VETKAAGSSDETVEGLIMHSVIVSRASFRCSDRIEIALGLRAIGIRGEDAVLAGPS